MLRSTCGASPTQGDRLSALAAAALLAALLAAQLAAAAGDAAAATLGAHSFLGQGEGDGTSPAANPPVDTAPSGSLLLAFYAGYARNDRAPVDNYGNLYLPLGPRGVYEGYGGAFDAKVYLATGARGGPGHVLSVPKPGFPSGEHTAFLVEVRGAARLQDWAMNYPQRGEVLQSGSVTTTGPALLVAIWAGDGPFKQHTAEPDAGFTVIERFLDLPPNSGVQAALAVRQVAAAGTYSVTWTEAPDQGAILWLFAFEAGAAESSFFSDGFE